MTAWGDTILRKAATEQASFQRWAPYLQQLARHGFPSGTRSYGQFNVAVYRKEINRDDWKTENA